MTWTGTLGSFTRHNGMAAALAEEEIYTIGLPVAGGTAPNPDQHAVTENALRRTPTAEPYWLSIESGCPVVSKSLFPHA